MSDQMVFTILGCGSSGGVPRIGGNWGDCDPTNPKNRRRRCSLMVERHGAGGITRVLIDTSPDIREQLLSAGVGTLDAVIFTHAHADHTHGIDDLRMIVINMRQRLPIWASPGTLEALVARFSYVFETPEGSHYPPILEMNTIDGDTTITGAGGPVTFTPIEVDHSGIPCLGFRIGGLAYIPDVIDMPAESWEKVQDLDVWIIDALRRTPHPSHLCLSQTLEWIDRAAPSRAILTNMHIDLDHSTVAAETPNHITPAFDGMTITLPV